jgi:hypothetical protein
MIHGRKTHLLLSSFDNAQFCKPLIHSIMKEGMVINNPNIDGY